MTGRRGLIFIMEWLIVADQATALMSGCFSGFCFVSSNLESEWRSRDYAEQWCSSNNGTQLIEVTRADIQLAMSSFLNSINGANLYSGRSLFTAGKRDPGGWTWVTKISASSLYIDTPSDVSYAYGYLQLQTTMSSRLTLTASRPTDAKQGYICEGGSQCTDRTGVLLNSRCYRSYSNEALSWYDARSKCLDNEGDLASFDFISQDQGLSALNGSWLTPSNTYWLGLRREWWTWKISQADVKYSYWSAGDHPRTLANDPSDCLCLEPSQWKWLECRCGEAKPLICFSEIRPSSATTTSTTTVTTPTTTTLKSTTTPTSATSPKASPSLSNESIHDVASTSSTANPTEHAIGIMTVPDGSSVPTTAAAALEQKHKEGLDRDIAIGIGVGVGGGVVVVILVVVVAVIIIRKRSKRSSPEKKEKTKKVKKLQTPDIIALQTTTTANQEENPYVTVIRLPDIGETSVSENAPSDKPETVYADLEFLTKSSLTNNSSADVVSETGSSRPSSPSRLAEADVEVDHIDYNADQYTIAATCATFL